MLACPMTASAAKSSQKSPYPTVLVVPSCPFALHTTLQTTKSHRISHKIPFQRHSSTSSSRQCRRLSLSSKSPLGRLTLLWAVPAGQLTRIFNLNDDTIRYSVWHTCSHASQHLNHRPACSSTHALSVLPAQRRRTSTLPRLNHSYESPNQYTAQTTPERLPSPPSTCCYPLLKAPFHIFIPSNLFDEPRSKPPEWHIHRTPET